MLSALAAASYGYTCCVGSGGVGRGAGRAELGSGSGEGVDQRRPLFAFLLSAQMGAEQIVRDDFLRQFAAFRAGYHGGPMFTIRPEDVIANPWGTRGYVLVRLADEEARACGRGAVAALETDCLLHLRSVEDVIVYGAHFRLSALDASSDEIEARLAELHAAGCDPVPCLKTAASFRVTCRRCGLHRNLKSPDVAKRAGAALHETYGTPGDMTNFSVNIRVDVAGLDVVVGRQLNYHALTRRNKSAFVNVVTVKSNVAYLMLVLAGVRSGDRIVDPFCGGGTILLEAASCFKNLDALGCDRNAKAIRGATENAATLPAHTSKLEFLQMDARQVHRTFEHNTFDAVVTNPPWGVMTGKDVKLDGLYKWFLCALWCLLKPGGKLVMIVLRGLMVLEIAKSLGQYKLISFQVVKTRNSLPTIIVLEKLEKDPERAQLREELFALSKFANMSTKLFNTTLEDASLDEV